MISDMTLTGIPQSDANPLAAELNRPWQEAQAKHAESMKSWRNDAQSRLDSAIMDWDGFTQKNPIDLRFAPDPETAKQKVAISSYLALANDGQEIPGGDMGEKLMRDRLADERFGGKGIGDDAAFYGEIVRDANDRKVTTEFFNELSDEAVKAATVGAVGESATSFQAWREQAKTKPGYKPGNDADYLEAWQASQQEMKARMEPFKDELAQVWQAMKGGGAGTASEVLKSIGADLLLGGGADGEDTVDELSKKNAGAVAFDVYEKLDESNRADFMKGLDALVKSFPKEERPSVIANLSKSGGRMVDDLARGAASRFSVKSLEESLYREAAKTMGPFSLSESEKTQASANAERIKRDRLAQKNFADDIRKIERGEYDPIRYFSKDSKDVFSMRTAESGLYGIPGVFASVGTVMLPGVGQSAMYLAMEDFAYSDLRDNAIRSGMSDADASLFADDYKAIAAVPQTGLEILQTYAPLGKLPTVNKVLMGMGDKIKNRLLRGAIKTGAISGAETVVEEAQNLTPYIVQDIASAFEADVTGAKWTGEGGAFDGFWTRQGTTFLSMMPLAVGGAMGGLNAEARDAAFANATTTQLQAIGATDEAIAAVNAANGPSSLREAVTNLWETRDPNSENAQVAAAQEEVRIAEEKAAAESAQLSGAMPIFTRNADGWTVTDGATGEEVGTAKTSADAMRIAAAHSSAINDNNADQTAFLGSLLQAAEVTNYFDGENRQTQTEIAPGRKITAAQEAAISPRDEARVMAQVQAKGDAAFSGIVLGKSVTEFKQGVRNTVNKINSGGSVLTVFHEEAHGFFREALNTGRLTKDSTIEAIRGIQASFVGKTTKSGEAVQFIPESGEVSDTQLDEAVSELMETLVLKNRKKTGYPADMVSKNLSSLARMNGGAKSFKAFVDTVREFFGVVFSRAYEIKKAIKEGKVKESDIEAFTNKLFGLDAQDEFDAASVAARDSILQSNIIGDIVAGRPVILYHGSANTGLKSLAANSSLTASKSLARKFAGKDGRVYEVESVVPSNNPLAWEAESLAEEIATGKISEAEAVKNISSRVSEVRIPEELPVEARDEILGGDPFSLGRWVGRDYKIDTDKTANLIENALIASGLDYDYDSSRVSESEYFKIRKQEDDSEGFKIRVSNHPLPLHHNQPDVDVGGFWGAYHWAAAVKMAADYAGLPLKGAAKSQLTKLEKADAIEKAKESSRSSFASNKMALDLANVISTPEALAAAETLIRDFPVVPREQQRGLMLNFYTLVDYKGIRTDYPVMIEAIKKATTLKSGEFPVEGIDRQNVVAGAARDEILGGDPFSIGRASVTTNGKTEIFEGAEGSLSVIGPAAFSIGAYHGTPHKVDKFSLDKIGTGEGAQAYGWGLYFAQSEKVAENYRFMLTKSYLDGGGYTNPFKAPRKSGNRWVVETAKSLTSFNTKKEAQAFKDAKDAEYELLNNPPRKGNLYSVTLDVNDEDLLDWDKPLSEQSEKVKAAFASIPEAQKPFGNTAPNGEAIYRRISVSFDPENGAFGNGGDAFKAASDKINKLGIPGVRYLDGNSRRSVPSDLEIQAAEKAVASWKARVEAGGQGAKDQLRYAENHLTEVMKSANPSYNYVMFDESKIIITEENGTPVETGSFSLGKDRSAMDSDYMKAVESGDMETAQRMVDEAAKKARYDIKAYHGTPDANFDVFKEDQFFTEDRNYAARFTDSSTSSSSFYGVRKTNPKVFSVFLNTEKLFDTRNPKHKKILKEKFSGKFGEGILTGAGLPDWVEGRDIAEFLKDEMTDDFDAIIVDEGKDDAGQRPPAFIIFNPNQIKSADPVTRDASGNVIPLSQRFDSSKDSISFSLGPARMADALADEAISRIKNPQARMVVMRALANKIATAKADLIAISEGRPPSYRERQTKESFDGAQHEQSMIALEDERQAAEDDFDQAVADLKAEEQGAIQDARADVLSKLGPNNGQNQAGKVAYNEAVRQAVAKVREAQKTKREKLRKEHTATVAKLDAKEKALAKRAAVSDTKAKGDRRRNAEVATVRQEMAFAKEQQRRDILTSLAMFDGILSVLPTHLRGKVGGYTTLASLTTDEARLKYLQTRVAKIDDVVQSFLKKEYSKMLDKLLERAKPKSESGKKPTGTLGPEGHRYFKLVDAAHSLNEKETAAAIKEVEQELEDADSENTELLADLAERWQVLTAFGNFAGKSAADMATAMETAQAVYNTKRNAWRIREESRLAGVKGIITDGLKYIGKSRPGDAWRGKADADKLSSKIKGGKYSLASFVGVLEAAFGRDSALTARWSKMARDGFRERTSAIIAAQRRWKTATEDATGLKGRKARMAVWSMATKRTVKATISPQAEQTIKVPIDTFFDAEKQKSLGLSQLEIDQLTEQFEALPDKSQVGNLTLKRMTRGESDTVDMTESEAIYLSMLWSQDGYKPALRTHGLGEDFQTEIEAGLSDAAKEIRLHLAREYANNYEPLRATFAKMYGVDLRQTDNYTPGRFYSQGDDNAMDVTGSGFVEGGFKSNFLNDRKKHLAKPKPENAFAVYFNHLNQTEHWKALAEFSRELHGVLGNPKLKEALQAKNPDIAAALNEWIKAIDGNGLNAPADGFLLSALLQSQAYLAMSWKASTILKNAIGSAINAAYAMPIKDFAKGYGRLMAGQIDFARVWDSDLIQNRLQGAFAPEARAAVSRALGAKPTMRGDFLLKGMEVIGTADCYGTACGAAVAYDFHYRAALRGGLSKEQADAVAMDKAAEVISKTAQPVEVTDRSLMELRLTGIGKLAFVFASEARQKSAMYVNSWGQILTGKATTADIRVLVISHFVMAPIMHAIGMMIRDVRDNDDEEWFDEKYWNAADFAKAMAVGPIGGLPLVRDLFDGFSGDSGPLKRLAESAIAAKRLFADEPKGDEVEWYETQIVKVLQGLSPTTAVGSSIFDQVFDVSRNFTD